MAKKMLGKAHFLKNSVNLTEKLHFKSIKIKI